MLRKVMLGKIHRATVTQTDVDYVGSITIDGELLEASGIRPNELVLIADIDNGNRFETYVLKGEPGSGIIGINGAAAKLVDKGDKVIIISFGYMTSEEMDEHGAQVVVVDEQNKIAQRLNYPSS